MDFDFKRTWAEISLDNMAGNYHQIRQKLHKDCKLMAIVKADAYGHGAVAVAKLMSDLGADYLGVATIIEAIELRKSGMELPILILGFTPPGLTAQLIMYNLTQAVFDVNDAHAFSDAATLLGQKLKVHIKVDTGMTRLGVLCQSGSDEKNSLYQIQEICQLPGLNTEGIFTHFANADIKNDSYTLEQFSRFVKLTEKLESMGIYFALKHCANSSTIIYYPQMQLDLVRPGIILYGAYPADDMRENISLRPAMSLKSVISQIKTVGKDVPVSYGCTYLTTRETRIAVAEVGYADGLMRKLSRGGQVYVHGKTVSVIGTICMDRCMLDVTDVDDIQINDVVTIFGFDGDVYAPVEQIAKCCETISYEVVCNVSKRVPRVLMAGEQKASEKSR